MIAVTTQSTDLAKSAKFQTIAVCVAPDHACSMITEIYSVFHVDKGRILSAITACEPDATRCTDGIALPLAPTVHEQR